MAIGALMLSNQHPAMAVVVSFTSSNLDFVFCLIIYFKTLEEAASAVVAVEGHLEIVATVHNVVWLRNYF